MDSQLISLRMLFIWIWMALCMVNCLSDYPNSLGMDVFQFPGSENKLDEGLFSYGSVCNATQGRWMAGLRSCICPYKQVFSAKKGCVNFTEIKNPLDRHGPFEHWGCFNVGSIAVGYDLCKSKDSLNDAVELEILDLLQGITIEGPNSENIHTALMLKPLSKFDIDFNLTQIDGQLQDVFMAQYAAADLSERFSGEYNNFKACWSLFQESKNVKQSTIYQLCNIIENNLQYVRSDLINFRELHSQHRGEGDKTLQWLLANLPQRSRPATYVVLGRHGMPLIRILKAGKGSEGEISVLLSPLGQVMGGRIEYNDALPNADPYFVRNSVVYFNGTFNPISFGENKHGHREDLRHAIHERLKSPGNNHMPPIATDGRYPPRFEPVKAMVLESNLIFQFYNLAHRFKINADAAYRFEQSGDLTSTVLGSKSSHLRRFFDVLNDTNVYQNSHGSSVSSLLVSDLLNAQVGLFPLENRDWLADPWASYTYFKREIQHLHPQVVNISISLNNDIGDCEATFNPIFNKFSEDILFVLAAGNDGEGDTARICPAMLGHRYPNVITVGGTDAWGHMHPLSNYGKKMVQIAAPFCADVIGDPAQPERLVQACGTSFSAPVVGNAALRLFAQDSSLSAPEVKDILMNSCRPQGLDVACAGAWNLKTMEAFLKQRKKEKDELS